VTDPISVQERSDGAFDVEVHQGATTTHHVVSVPANLPARLGAPELDRARLVRVSFDFLLAREPAQSILRRFDLDVISRYFPEYLEDMASRLS
jgi:hypothetical protein